MYNYLKTNTMKNFINEINQFYPAYLKAHNDMTNQVLHFIGATLFFVLLGIGSAIRKVLKKS
jgi:hypothetical protein